MDCIKSRAQRVERPIRVVQFGEGNFLRAFVDYMLDIANEKGYFNGNILIVKPIAFGTATINSFLGLLPKPSAVKVIRKQQIPFKA